MYNAKRDEHTEQYTVYVYRLRRYLAWNLSKLFVKLNEGRSPSWFIAWGLCTPPFSPSRSLVPLGIRIRFPRTIVIKSTKRTSWVFQCSPYSYLLPTMHSARLVQDMTAETRWFSQYWVFFLLCSSIYVYSSCMYAAKVSH